VAQKKSQYLLQGRKRGRLTTLCESQVLVGYNHQAVTEGTCIESACGESDISLRTYRRAKGGDIITDKRPFFFE
jgi:hypothetical protein